MAVRKRKKTRARAKTKKRAKTRKKTTRRRTKARKTTKRKTTRRKATRKKSGKRKSSGLTKLQYSLSAPLAAIVGCKKSTRPQVVKKLWVYIKAKKLQDSKNRRMINPDTKLAAVLGSRPINMLKMAGALSKHLKKA